MLIGDSFAEGPGVNIDEIFAKIIEKILANKFLILVIQEQSLSHNIKDMLIWREI